MTHIQILALVVIVWTVISALLMAYVWSAQKKYIDAVRDLTASYHNANKARIGYLETNVGDLTTAVSQDLVELHNRINHLEQGTKP